MFYAFYEKRGYHPEVIMVSNQSHAVQSIVGRSDAMSLRFIRPSIDFSPLGDQLAYVSLNESDVRPNLVVATLTSSSSTISREALEFISICRDGFDSGVFDGNFLFD